MKRGDVVLKDSRIEALAEPLGSGSIAILKVHSFYQDAQSSTSLDVIRAFESEPSVLISQKSLHKRTGSMPAQATHKVFGYLGYNFYEYDWCYNPYLGIGGEVEFDARSCEEWSALNQWSVWIKGGFEF